MTDTHATIYPEAIHRRDIKQPGPWTVQTGPRGAVMLDKKQAMIPTHEHVCETCGVDHAAAVRMHEMAHVAFTPANGPSRAKRRKIHANIKNGVEDMRISTRMAAAGKPIPATCCPDYLHALLDHAVALQNWPDFLAHIAAARSDTATERAAADWYHKQDAGPAKKMFSAAWDILSTRIARHPLPRYEDTLIAARELQALLPGHDAPGNTTPDEMAGKGWQTMRIEEPPRARPARNAPVQKWTNRDEGTNPRAMHHYATDGRIFGQKAKKPEPMTVLIDGSGSMSWHAADLRRLLDIAPASTVAIYDSDGYRGKLRILAANGKRVNDSDVRPPYGGSDNGVDGPALAWLAKHKGRKIWVSDGGVTGGDGASDRDLHRQCREIITRYGIMRVDDADAAIAVTRGKRRFQPSDRQSATGRGY